MLPVKVGVLADDLRLEELIIFFVDFVKDLVDICRAQSLSLLSQFALIARSKYEESVHDRVLSLHHIDELVASELVGVVAAATVHRRHPLSRLVQSVARLVCHYCSIFRGRSNLQLLREIV